MHQNSPFWGQKSKTLPLGADPRAYMALNTRTFGARPLPQSPTQITATVKNCTDMVMLHNLLQTDNVDNRNIYHYTVYMTRNAKLA